MTFGQALEIHRANFVQTSWPGKPNRHYWNQIYAALLKSWRDLATRDIRRITAADCEEWAATFAVTSSATRYNNTIAGLKHVFEVAIGSAIIYSNPAATLERIPVRQKRLELPTTSQFHELLDTIKKAGGWCSRDCADFVEGLAVIGARKRDAGELDGATSILMETR